MKMRSLTLSVLVTLLALTSCKKESVEPTPINNDPELLGAQTDKVTHYGFNSDLNDGSGNNMNAVSSANITYTADRFGRANQAAVFGGPSNISYVVTPTLSSKVTGFPFAISLWFKASDINNSQTLIKSDGGEATTYSGYWLQIGSTGPGTMSFNFGNNTTTSYAGRNSIITPAIITANTWYHVVVNVRGANDMDFYLNGVKNTSTSYDGAATAMVYTPAASQGVLGIFPGSSSIFGGVLDDYRIYKKVLSFTEISTLYNFHP